MIKWLVVVLLCSTAIEATLRSTKVEVAIIAQNSVGSAALLSKRNAGGEQAMSKDRGGRQQKTKSSDTGNLASFTTLLRNAMHQFLLQKRNETKKNETRSNETQGNERGKNESKENESKNQSSANNETQVNKTGENETKGNEPTQNETKGNETREDENNKDISNRSSVDVQYTIKTVEKRARASKYLYVKEVEDGWDVNTRDSADGDECRWTLYTGHLGGITVANVKWPDRHLSIIYETEVNQQSWKYVADTCTDDGDCYDEWEFYTLKGAEEGVMMYFIAEERYLEKDCHSSLSPTKDALWIFEPPLPASFIKGEHEEPVDVLDNMFR